MSSGHALCLSAEQLSTPETRAAAACEWTVAHQCLLHAFRGCTDLVRLVSVYLTPICPLLFVPMVDEARITDGGAHWLKTMAAIDQMMGLNGLMDSPVSHALSLGTVTNILTPLSQWQIVSSSPPDDVYLCIAIVLGRLIDSHSLGECMKLDAAYTEIDVQNLFVTYGFPVGKMCLMNPVCALGRWMSWWSDCASKGPSDNPMNLALSWYRAIGHHVLAPRAGVAPSLRLAVAKALCLVVSVYLGSSPTASNSFASYLLFELLTHRHN